jgi:UV DNA damage repair endonuclease
MKIGFCCKWIDNVDQIDGFKPQDDAKRLNTRVTTVAWLNRQTQEVAEQRLWDLMVHNIESIRLLVERVGNLHEHLRMVRLGSDILPVYTEPTWSYFWRRHDVRDYCERHLPVVGELARRRGVRLSFHPGQFVVLASESADIVDRSLEEFEYHVDMARWMGFGKTFQDFKINVHIAGRQGAEGIRRVWSRLSTEAQRMLTIENDETRWGLEESLKLKDLCALVLDIHHHWIRTGEYIQPQDSRVCEVIESWRGVRPALHYSLSPESIVADHCPNTMPCLSTLVQSGKNRMKLRAHSNFYWNDACNDWALSFEDFDIQCESKAKNLASFALAERLNTNKSILLEAA